MKKMILSVAALAAVATTTNAQSVRFGVKGGANFSNSMLENKTSGVTSPFGVGGYAGGLVEFSFKKPSDKFKLQLEANYDFYNLRTKATVNNATVVSINRFHSISVPLEAKYFITPSFSVFAGPTFNFNLASNTNLKTGSTQGDRTETSDYLNPFQIGGVVGANYYIVKGFFVEARYNYIAPRPYDRVFGVNDLGATNNIQVGIGYKFDRSK
ncbi:porin family protein [Edaphocola flava]|jgi:hypothetical protein|uniref:porin family protein n=1 Tax=Edaphocola flava TaxID=2499629 RepID=UPI00100A869D|nr:porin family protein [Edaphocola flava]